MDSAGIKLLLNPKVGLARRGRSGRLESVEGTAKWGGPISRVTRISARRWRARRRADMCGHESRLDQRNRTADVISIRDCDRSRLISPQLRARIVDHAIASTPLPLDHETAKR
jgi:hypothetical protein